ncbi:MAG: endolytic transglycosylase MltG [Lachnospiraceae bacterium]|nr:endolytic transglycosylase MltG [Lachnospiraceae bacterium]
MDEKTRVNDWEEAYIEKKAAVKSQAADKKNTVGLKILAVVLAVFVILVCMALGYHFGYKAVTYNGGTGKGIQTEVVINEGDSLGEVASKLYKAGVIEDKLVFMFQARFYDYDIEPGKYILDDAMPYKDIFIKLENGGY